jgi:pepF/M3 family oligoendopeptidase
LNTVYSSPDSEEFKKDLEYLDLHIQRLSELLKAPLEAEEAEILAILWVYMGAQDIAENLHAYGEAIYTVDTRNAAILGTISAVEQAALPLGRLTVLLRTRLAEQAERVRHLALNSELLAEHRFFLLDSLEKALHQMSPDLEDLAHDLERSGSSAWSRLQEALSSTLEAPWDGGEGRTVTALRDLALDPDRNVRERAFRAELGLWKGAETALAAALNGVKGTALSLDKRRLWKDQIEKSAFQSRLGEAVLASLIEALESSLPLFQRYLKTKARLLGLDRLAFYDLFAPLSVSGSSHVWSWEDAAEYVAQRFDSFDPDMGAFARSAFERGWIDAEVRPGKIGGAYCTDFPLARESRILCNFNGSFDAVSTLAHELGHAWHHEQVKDLPRTRSQYPATLAETASIFAETLVFEDALRLSPEAERLALIEGNLKDSCQVIVDILSRFYFEKALFERREKGDVPPEELCALMLDAQKRSYGSALDPEALHPYMWAVKSHYYNADFGFYNYPYAFGLLFALALYRRAQEEGPAFARTYRELLAATGECTVPELAKRAGFDLTDPAFWQTSLGIIAQRADEFARQRVS